MNMENRPVIFFLLFNHIFFVFLVRMSYFARNINCTTSHRINSDLDAELDEHLPQTSLEEHHNPPDYTGSINLENLSEENESNSLPLWLQTDILDRYTKILIRLPVHISISDYLRTAEIWRRILQCGLCKSLVVGKVFTENLLSRTLFDVAQYMFETNGCYRNTGFYKWDFRNSGVNRICPYCDQILNVNTESIYDGVIYQQCQKCEAFKKISQCKLFLSGNCLLPTCNDCYRINSIPIGEESHMLCFDGLVMALSDD